MTKTKQQPTQQQLDDRSRARNPNYGTNGTNLVNAHVHGNRGDQIHQHRASQQQLDKKQGRTGE